MSGIFGLASGKYQGILFCPVCMNPDIQMTYYVLITLVSRFFSIYCGWTMTMDFGMDQCLQSDTPQSHSLGADWIVK